MRGALILAVLALSGCGFTPQGTAIRNAVEKYGAQAYDEGLENAVYFVCNVASVGAVRRKWGQSPEVYTRFCEASGSIIKRADSIEEIKAP